MKRLAPKKSLGQNFLVDKNIAKKIAREFAPSREELILEIGPGEGALTEELLPYGPSIVAIELDHGAVQFVRNKFADNDSIEVVEGDFLKTNIRDLVRERGVDTVRVIGNIPYYITSPILFHLFEHRDVVSDAMLMMQREVAERLIAVTRTKAYGILSVMAQTYADPALVFHVPPTCFFPQPKVVSSVTRLQMSLRKDVDGIESNHRRLVRAGFGKRRKTLNNALSELIPHGEQRAELFERAEINPRSRAEELTPGEFIRLARVFSSSFQG